MTDAEFDEIDALMRAVPEPHNETLAAARLAMNAQRRLKLRRLEGQRGI